MTDDVKLFVRPKVRFYQTDTNESAAGESKRTIDQKNIGQSNKPRIISIVTLDKPVKLVKSNKSCNNKEDKNLKTFDSTRKNDSLTVCSNAPPLYTLDENPIEIENQKPLSDNTNIKNIKANSKDIKPKISNKRSHNNVVPSSVSLVEQDKNLNKTVKSQNFVKTNASRSYVKSKKGKENETLDDKGNNYLTKKFSDLEITAHKTKSCSSRTTSKKANATSKTLAASKRNLSTKSNVMPCHKYLKAASKVKSSPVKKTVIRDVDGPKIKPYIGPGVLRKKNDDLKTPETDERTFMKPSTSGEKLAKPEYNSIMCTINKLNEMKKQKITTDIEHLPVWCKHFINGKISTALDFPLDEAVYKNLVDLSIDESQLPCRLIRSKDPEPRQKDAVPILSDFFIPVSTEEYCTSVSRKPRTPETTEIWNAFRVSDKIFEWKHILDHV
ncbi:uncharacterized protein LOC100882288 [Megachile rotundata]|uniref:uncharacterized protein LOC100882288 n=1 Tax=Megachile rotundata TaxID=143995 RepID=UPI000614BBE9|nr:PREDICTED: probable serine/threonine-protein kinase DDB_G0278901 [Megachile rotundata]